MPFPFCCCSSSSSSSHHLSSSTPHLKRSALQAAASNLTKIFEELKCPVCFNVCVPPIHNCINGHIICNSCRLKGHVTSCPTCRQSLCSGARNMFAENFVLNYAQQCCYASQGCEHLRLKGCNMKPHEEKCMFRPVKCIVGTCGLRIPYKNFLAHLDCGHKASGTDRLPTQVQFKFNPKMKNSCPKWLPYYIQAFDNIYYVMMQRVGAIFWVWVYSQLGKEADDLEYTYHAFIKLKHPEKRVTVSWHGPVYPIRTPFKTIQSEGYSFTLPSSLVKNFAGQGSLNFSVDIKKLPRRSLKGVKLPGDGDSETAVVSSSLPAEYNRPPSFYEPNSVPPGDMPPAEYPPPSQQEQQEGILDENGNSPQNLQLSSSILLLNESSKTKDELSEIQCPQLPSIPKRRSAAIGIPSFSSPFLPPSQTSTVTSFLDTTPPPADMLDMVTTNDEAGDDDDFGDKISPCLEESSCVDLHKTSCSYFTPN